MKGQVINPSIDNIYSLTPLQEGMLYHSLESHDSTGYIIQNVFSLSGVVDEGLIRQAAGLLAVKHDILRTSIVHKKLSNPRQIVLKSREPEFESIDLTGLSEQDRTDEFERIKTRDVRRGFDLQKDTLLRFKYVILGENNVKMIWSYHHIILDGWCLSLLFGDFLRYYNGLKNGVCINEMQKTVLNEKALLPEYGEYVRWLESKGNEEEAASYWRELLYDYENIAEINPLDKPEVSDRQVKKREVSISRDLSRRLSKTASSNNLTLSTIMEAAWGIVLQKYNFTDDVVFGKIVSGRNVDIQGIEKVAGLFINTIPVRVKCARSMTARELLEELKKQDLESDNYFYSSLAEIQRSTRLKNELIKTLFAYENYYFDEECLMGTEDGLRFELEDAREQTNYDITVAAYMDKASDMLKLIIMYNPNKYSDDGICLIQERMELVLQALAANPDVKVEDITFISETEKELVMNGFNNTSTDYPKDKSLVEILEDNAGKLPDNIALVHGNSVLTYRMLNEKANALAWKLRKMGVRSNDMVAVIAHRSIEYITGICGVLKAGGAYVPIDSGYPADRIKYMLEDSKPKAVLTYRTKIETGIPLIDLEDKNVWTGRLENPKRVNKPDDPAHVIYTSGTTGHPKGSLIPHKGIIRLVMHTNFVDFNINSVITQTGSIAFDASTFEIWGALLNGSRLVLLDDDVLTDSVSLKKVLIKQGVNIMFLTTALFNLMVQTDATVFDGIGHLLFGGEKASEKHVRLLRNHNNKTKLTNCYGPTESTVMATTYGDIPVGFHKLPIGKPIANTGVYILNKNNLCGIGIPGELCIAGDGLAKGYLNQPELTAEKFSDNPFGEGRMYRSGDLARWLPDGNIEFMGRIDEQVKVRGFRIELGEIESVIKEIAYVKDASVVAREDADGDKAIHAYLVAEGEVSVSEVRSMLREALPEYMVPSYMMQIENIPMTRSGKVDKHALPEIVKKSGREYTEPRNECEKAICGMFGEVLGIEKVGVNDNFLELGGDSIKSIRIVSKMRAKGYEISVRQIMGKYTVEGIAGIVMANSIKNTYEQGEVVGVIKETPVIKDFLRRGLANPSHFNQDIMLQIDADDESLIRKALDALAIHHDMLRAVCKNGIVEILGRKESKLYDFIKYDLSDDKRNKGRPIPAIMEEVCTSLQGGMDPVNGPLMKSALFKTPEGNFLFICLHHLVVDGVSWRILCEDLRTALRQAGERKEIVLPAKTASFKEWAEALDEYRGSTKLKRELKYWEEAVKGLPDGRLKLGVDGKASGYGRIRIEFTREETGDLVYKAGKAFRTKVEDLLVCAVGMAVRKLTGQEKVGICLEGHGREEIHKKIAVDRTVGWFTSMYPVIVECKDDIKECIISAKEALHRVPNHGIGYGLLKDNLPGGETDVYFNYLGQMDAETKEGKIAFCESGKNSADENGTPGLLDINGILEQNKLSFIILFNKAAFSNETMEKFAHLYKEFLRQIISYCTGQTEHVKTASDYSASDLSASDYLTLQGLIQDASEIEDIYSLTPMQEGILYHSINDNKSLEYVVQVVFDADGTADSGMLEKALELLVNRYDVLRTVFIYDRLSKPRQVVLRTMGVDFEKIDLSSLGERDSNNRLEGIKDLDVKHGFNLQKGPLMRVKYVVFGQDNSKLVLSHHHIILDGWCLPILINDWQSYYSYLTSGTNAEELKKSVSRARRYSPGYGEYLGWLEAKDREEAMAYWEELLSGYEGVADIKPTENPAQTELQVERMPALLSGELSGSLRRAASANRVTVNTMLETAWGIVLQAYNHTDDVVFGKVVSGRNADVAGIENMVGLFVNTIPIRVKSHADMTVRELLQEIKRQGTESESRSYCSLAEIQALTAQKGELIKTLYVFENYYVDEGSLKESSGGIRFRIESAREQTNYAITMASYSDEKTSRLGLLAMYDPNRYTPGEIRRVTERMEKVLVFLAENPEGKAGEIETVTETEKQLILNDFNDTVTDYPRDRSVAALFEEQAGKAPGNVAVVYGDRKYTYGELNKKANQVARKLKELGVGPDNMVAVLAERSLEMIAGIVGIMKAGGAYVPLPPNYPRDRIRFMLKDCQPKAILTYRAEIETRIPVIDLSADTVWEGYSENLEHAGGSEDLAYVIYTSGTTGYPKGSMTNNRSIVRLVKNTNYIELDGNTVIMQTGSMAFDASTLEVWGALLNGGKLILGDNETITNPLKLKEEIEKNSVNTMFLTTALYNQMIQADRMMFDSLRYLLVGGEKASEKHMRMLKSRNVEFIHCYGPTENTTFTTTYRIPDGFERLPIGKPIANTTVYILSRGKLCGIGIPGELCTGGDGLARGYLNHPELTGEKFTENPFGEGKLYHTGDLARWLPDGNIEYLDRMDEQVKLRGFRVELSEIENALRKMEYVRNAAVIVKEDTMGDKAIHAYIVGEGEIDIPGVRDALREQLPDYMIPAYMMQIENIPVTRNGKVDKCALPEIEHKSVKKYEAPRSGKEKIVSAVIGDILGVKKVGVKDNFFELGGDSIKAIRIVSRMRSAGYEVSAKDIMGRYTVESIAAAAVETARGGKGYGREEVTGRVKLTPIVREFLSWRLAKPDHFNQDILIETDTGDEEEIRKALNALAVHHDMLRAVYRGNGLEILSSRESKMYDFYTYDYGSMEALENGLERECTKIHGGMELEKGPLMKAALFRSPEGNRLFLCIHHLVVDGVSWRILLEDFDTAMKQVRTGKEVIFQEKTASYREWAEALEEYGSKYLEKERKYWEEVACRIEDGRMRASREGEGKGYGSVKIALGEEETRKLLNEAGRAYNTGINDLLVGAVGMAVRKLTGQEKVSVRLEGHGREELHKRIAVDRTVGWFTSMYPVIVECCDGAEESIVSTKETLRGIPKNGIGYGLLKDKLACGEPEISFNYLGQMDAEGKAGKMAFCATGKSSADENDVFEGIAMNGSIIGNALVFVITYGRDSYSGDVIARLAEHYEESLRKIIKFCCSTKKALKTASDYSAIGLNMPDLSRITNRYGDRFKIADIYSLTPMQEGMLYHKITDCASSVYVIQEVLRMKHEYDEEKIRQALILLTMRYDALRTAIVYEKLLVPRQVVFETRDPEYEKIDLSALPDQTRMAEFEKIKTQDVARGFDLQEDALLRVKYVILGRNDVRMIWSYHHIILDGWCMSLLFGDFTRYYDLLDKGCSSEYIQDCIREERAMSAEYGEYLKWLEAKDKDDAIRYWNELLADYEGSAEIKPSIRPANTEQRTNKAVRRISNELSKMVLQTAVSNNITPNTIVEAAWGFILSKYNHTDDVVFGKVVSGRNVDIPGMEDAVGLFINTIPARLKYNSTTTIRELLEALGKQGIESDGFSYCSLAEIQAYTRQGSGLIKTLYAFENYYIKEESVKGREGWIQFEIESLREQTNYAVTIAAYMDEDTAELRIVAIYDPEKYASEEIKLVLERIETVIEFFVNNPEARLGQVETATRYEKSIILESFNDTDTAYQKNSTIVDLFEKQVEKTPENIALEFGDYQLTYRQFNDKVNQLAWKLIALGVVPDNLIAVAAQRSQEMIVGIFGIIKAGGAYVPLDPTYPRDRIKFMLEDCKPKAVLTYNTKINTDIQVIDLADSRIWEGTCHNPPKVNKPEDLAYVIYTSGTTGMPKGVMLQQRGVVSMQNYLKDLYKVDGNDCVLQFSNYVFDASVWEMTMALLNGARLVIIDKETISDIEKFDEYVGRHKISIALLPPQYYLQTNIKGFKALTTGGSSSNRDIVRKAVNNDRYINAYGPTENTVLATHWEYNMKSGIPSVIPIGKPISNSKIYIIDGSDLCGFGIPGELCIAGDGLARGYLNRPELTAERFIDNPYGEGKLYRSGDLARWLPDGNIEYLGRIDEQVKIRGYRIELGEIENVIRDLDYIKDVVAIACEDSKGDKRINAYIVAEEKISFAKLKEDIRRTIPDYMVPARITRIESIPLTRSGKVDKKTLINMDIDIPADRESYVEVMSDYEKTLKTIWQDLLNYSKISIFDNFWDIGGNSLLVSRMKARIDVFYPNILTVGDIFANPTIAMLARQIEQNSAAAIQYTQITFPDAFFERSPGETHNIDLAIKAPANINTKISALYKENESKLKGLLLFTYSYILQQVTGEKEFSICSAFCNSYSVIGVDAGEIDDLNEFKEMLLQAFQKAEKYQNFNARVTIKPNGLAPIFLYNCHTNGLHKEFADFSVSCNIDEAGAVFRTDVFNKRLSEKSIFQFLSGYIETLDKLFR